MFAKIALDTSSIHYISQYSYNQIVRLENKHFFFENDTINKMIIVNHMC